MNVAELVDFVKVSPTNGELPDVHPLIMMMFILMMMMFILMMILMIIIIMMASQQILTSYEDHGHQNDSIEDDGDAQMVSNVQCPVPNVHNVRGQSDRGND